MQEAMLLAFRQRSNTSKASTMENNYAPSSSSISMGPVDHRVNEAMPSSSNMSNHLPPLVGSAALTGMRYRNQDSGNIKHRLRNHAEQSVPSIGKNRRASSTSSGNPLQPQKIYDFASMTTAEIRSKASVPITSDATGENISGHLPALSRSPSRENSTGDGRSRRPPIMTPDSAMKQFMHKLSQFEHREIFTYPKVIYMF